MQRMKGERDHVFFFFPTGSWGWGLEHNHYSHQNKRVCLAAFHTYRASPLEQGFIF